MESKFKYFLVGFFLILFVALFVVVVLILYKGFYRVEYKTYLIKTTYSVNGLELGSPVKYKGVSVGKVKSIEVNWENPSEILIFVDIDERLRIDGRVYATLGLQGITGLAYISLEESKEPLPIEKEGEYYVIPFKPSTFQEISDFIPNMLSEVHKLMKDLRKFVNSIDTKAINQAVRIADKTLKNLNTKIDLLAQRIIKLQKDLSSLIVKGEDTLVNVDKLITELQETTKGAQETLYEFKELAKETRSEIPEFTQRFDELSHRLEKVIKDIDKFVKKLNTAPSELLTKERTKPAPVER